MEAEAEIKEFRDLQLEALKSIFKQVDAKFIETQFKNTEFDFAQTKEIIKVFFEINDDNVNQPAAVEPQEDEEIEDIKDLLLLPENEHAHIDENIFADDSEKFEDKFYSDEQDYNGKYQEIEELKDAHMSPKKSAQKLQRPFIERDYKDLSISQILHKQSKDVEMEDIQNRNEFEQKEMDDKQSCNINNEFNLFNNNNEAVKKKKMKLSMAEKDQLFNSMKEYSVVLLPQLNECREYLFKAQQENNEEDIIHWEIKLAELYEQYSQYQVQAARVKIETNQTDLEKNCVDLHSLTLEESILALQYAIQTKLSELKANPATVNIEKSWKLPKKKLDIIPK